MAALKKYQLQFGNKISTANMPNENSQVTVRIRKWKEKSNKIWHKTRYKGEVKQNPAQNKVCLLWKRKFW